MGCGSSDKKAEETTPKNTNAEGAASNGDHSVRKSQIKKTSFCKGWGYTRKISIAPSEAGVCEVIYVKERQTEVIATAQKQESHCEEVYNRVKTKLADAGFHCEESE